MQTTQQNLPADRKVVIGLWAVFITRFVFQMIGLVVAPSILGRTLKTV